MNETNLFIRLESYARENFTTETLAYILQNDRKVKRSFLELLLAQRKEVLAAFGDYDIKTQPAYIVGRPDLEITSKNDHTRKIYVEVKTQSKEGEGQIQKYLQLRGYVAYLTPRNSDDPSLPDGRDGFLGHFRWHEVYSLIKVVSPHKVIHKQFLEYLEARHMGPLKPIRRGELRTAGPAVDFVGKLQELVQCVRRRVEKKYWTKQFGENAGAKRIHDDILAGDFYYWWYQPKSWWKKRTGFYLCFGTGFDFGEDRKREPKFYLFIGSDQNPFGRDLDSQLAPQFRKLCAEYGWKRAPDTSEYYWGYWKFFPLGTGDVDKLADRHAENVRLAVAQLQKLHIIDLMKTKIS
jgi:hypothetical protein